MAEEIKKIGDKKGRSSKDTRRKKDWGVEIPQIVKQLVLEHLSSICLDVCFLLSAIAYLQVCTLFCVSFADSRSSLNIFDFFETIFDVLIFGYFEVKSMHYSLCKDFAMQESQSLRSQHSWICAETVLHDNLDQLEGGLAQVTSALVQHWLTPTTCAGWTLMLAMTFFVFSVHVLFIVFFFKPAMYQGIWEECMSSVFWNLKCTEEFGKNPCQIFFSIVFPVWSWCATCFIWIDGIFRHQALHKMQKHCWKGLQGGWSIFFAIWHIQI